MRRWQSINAGIVSDALAGLAEGSREALTGLLPALRELVEAIDRGTDGTPGVR